MPQATREIKRRLKSIKSTGKITKAMELVSAVKMRKAVDHMQKSRIYSTAAWQIVSDLVVNISPAFNVLLTKRKIKKIAVVLIASNRGLCGSFNGQIISTALQAVITETKQAQDKIEVEFIILGKKARDVALKYQQKVAFEFTKADLTLKAEEVFSLSKTIIDDYIANKYDKVILAYTDYKSSLKQVPHIVQLLPIPRHRDPELGEEETLNIDIDEKKQEIELETKYLFEPSAKNVLDKVLPRLVETEIYQAVLESEASEHSARMLAMQNATEAAHDLNSDLTLAYNQARQNSITQEIAEISGAKAAMQS